MNAFSVLFYLTHTFDSNLTAKLALVLKEYLLTYFFLHQYALVSAEPSSRWNELSKVLFSLPPKGMFPSAKHCSSDRFSTPKKKKKKNGDMETAVPSHLRRKYSLDTSSYSIFCPELPQQLPSTFMVNVVWMST